MSEEHNLNGARKYFDQAVFDLACGTESLQGRIERAYDYSLNYVQTTDLKDFDLKMRIDTVIAAAQKGGHLVDDDARSTAMEIVEIAFRLRRPSH
jgi:hypothetical protein